jgi:hypothetical protein
MFVQPSFVRLAVWNSHRKIIWLFMRGTEDVFAQTDLVFAYWRYVGQVLGVKRLTA